MANQSMERIIKNDLVTLFIAFTNKYIVNPLQKTQFTSHLVGSLPSTIITVTLFYSLISLLVYESILHVGVQLNFWKNPADEVFDEIPVHCAHVYVSINLLEKHKDHRKNDLLQSKQDYMLKRPILYHFEFSPEEYAHEEWGTDLKFLRKKVLKWFLTSQVYYLNKDAFKNGIELTNIHLYKKNGKLLEKEEEYLCKLDINTGETVICIIHY